MSPAIDNWTSKEADTGFFPKLGFSMGFSLYNSYRRKDRQSVYPFCMLMNLKRRVRAVHGRLAQPEPPSFIFFYN
jgi:hypothetical protein